MIKTNIILIAVLLLVSSVVGCSNNNPAVTMSHVSAPAVAERPILAENVYIKAASGKDLYLPGEETTIQLSFTNNTDEPYEISPFPPLIEIRAGENRLIRTYPAGRDIINVGSKETIEYTLVWDQRDEQGWSVPCGQYWFVIPNYATIYSSLGSIYILPEEGVMEKTIAIGTPQTAEGTTFILERVELMRRGIRFWALNEGYYGPPVPAYAQYSLDDGFVREYGKVDAIGGGTGIDGMEYMWSMNIPVPNTARELTFTITRFGEIEGLWEFQFQLKYCRR